MTLTETVRRLWDAFSRNDLSEILARIGLFLSAIVLLNSSLTNWVRFPIATNGTALLLVIVAWLFAGSLIVLSFLGRMRASKLAFLIPVAGVFAIASNHWIFVSWAPRYGSDALAFLHYSAMLTLQGRNPFQESMLPSLSLFGVSPFVSTPLETGQLIDRTPYPALAFLVYVPAAAVGISDIRIVSLAFHIVAILILYYRVKGTMRFLAPLTVIFTNDLLDLTPGGATDIIWVVPAILMAMDLRRVPRAAIWYGIACSIKPTPIFLGPFLFVWYYRSSDSDSTKTKLRDPILFSTISSLVFVATNAPFIVASPGSWLSSVASPLAAPLVLYGSGFSAFGQFGFAPLPRISYTIIAAIVFSVLLSALFFRFERFRYAFWLFPAVVLFFAPRSIHHYYIYWYSLAFLGLTGWASEFRKRKV